VAAKKSQKADWFRDLAGQKPLAVLAKSFPVFNKREEILTTLCEYDIQMSRALWFIKMTASYYQNVQASRDRRRTSADPCVGRVPGIHLDNN
jgi:mediator of RNA polymerase II transcription subunit 12